ncbi:hypothetical protein [Flavobacterium sp. UMI-01]|uniref:hypothetical protein n=1 Tax=Flavobacterium sp. UMI-01 TaxID=1441053 RepID=UPI001C7DCBF5|nr:hypothetical protein [Flavobacterium sp. UMI-01]GIZ08390.1 hypothetical protein FUMI01_11170 [Flavobacterium sp. UMI-01]
MTTIINNWKTIAIMVLLATVVWFYKDYQFQKTENQRQSENASQLRKADSLRFTSQNLTIAEIKDYLQYQNPDLQKKLENNNIKLGRIESIVSSNYQYRDTIKKEKDVTELVDAIKKAIPKTQSWTDTSQCLTIKGNVSFDGQKLKVTVNDREFKNKSDGVAYWQRRQWSFLGIKTRFLGKKEFTAKQFDECGQSQVLRIQKKE